MSAPHSRFLIALFLILETSAGSERPGVSSSDRGLIRISLSERRLWCIIITCVFSHKTLSSTDKSRKVFQSTGIKTCAARKFAARKFIRSRFKKYKYLTAHFHKNVFFFFWGGDIYDAVGSETFPSTSRPDQKRLRLRCSQIRNFYVYVAVGSETFTSRWDQKR